MTTFDEREQAFEKKFAHDAEMQFKAAARRNKKLGHWAGAKMGLSGAELDAYAGEVVASDLEEAGEEDVYRKISGDFTAKGVTVDEAEIRAQMASLMTEAKAEIMEE